MLNNSRPCYMRNPGYQTASKTSADNSYRTRNALTVTLHIQSPRPSGVFKGMPFSFRFTDFILQISCNFYSQHLQASVLSGDCRQ